MLPYPPSVAAKAADFSFSAPFFCIVIFYTIFNSVEDRLHLNNKRKKGFFFVLCSICTIFATESGDDASIIVS